MSVPFLIAAVLPLSALKPPVLNSPAPPMSSVPPALSKVPVTLTVELVLRLKVPSALAVNEPPRFTVLPVATLIVPPPLLLQLGAVALVGARVSVVPVPVVDTTPVEAFVKVSGVMLSVPADAFITPALLIVVAEPVRLSVLPRLLASIVPLLLMMSAL